jgi:polysaccharide chain length determinant protein (PEP-CTERM system associated)
VKPVVDEDLGARLASMREQILSRSRIQPIIERYNLFADSQATMDDRVDTTQKAIGVKPIPAGANSRGMPGFFITFKARDARTAQQVCSDITSLFVSENLNARQQSAEGTTEFLKQQLGDAKRSLDDQDAKLAAFEQKYIGRLPGQEGSNAGTLQALSTQLDAATQNLNRTLQEETFIQAMISQRTNDAQIAEPTGVATVDERKKEMKALVEQKLTLETLYTPDHPDVVAITRRISDLQAEIDRADKAPQPAASPSTSKAADTPQVQQLKAQLRAIQQSIVSAKQEQTHISEQIGAYESRVAASPVVEEQYKQVTRDHETALQFYNSLLTKMNESTMATALEQRQQGEQFLVMDQANLPDAPTFPNRYIFAGGGFAFGLLVGIGLAALLEYRDTSLRNEMDIWAFTKLPTLAIISHIDDLTDRDAKHHRRKWFSRSPRPLESEAS